jgi:pimeloyl-ACP methyl ester carboxylesterase
MSQRTSGPRSLFSRADHKVKLSDDVILLDTRFITGLWRTSTTIATGTEDIVIPASNALKLVNAIPGAWLAQFPHGGHAFIAQYPQALADLINSFLALSTAHKAE